MSNSRLIKQSMDYIEAQISEELCLENLASLSFFSKYHFHRLFKADTGKTIMEYVRERRLTQASHELRFSSKTVTDIAYGLGFHSHDAFDKAFKKVYGITPIEYRNRMNSKGTQSITKEFFTMNYTSSIVFSFSIAEKEACLPLLDLLIQLSKLAHKSGLLSLEHEVTENHPFLLQKGLNLLLCGTEPLELQEILDNYIIVGNYSGKELLSRILIRNGILSIQVGEYPWVIREKLAAFFGEDFAKEINKHFGINAASRQSKLNEFINRICNMNCYSEATSLLESPFEKLNQRSIQRILREIDPMELAMGMKGASGITQIKILEGLPSMSAATLIDLQDLLEDIGSPQIVDAQKGILGVMKQLKVDGEIV